MLAESLEGARSPGATDRGRDIVGDGLLEGVEASTEPLGDSYDG
jgi:hypothetical protein